MIFCILNGIIKKTRTHVLEGVSLGLNGLISTWLPKISDQFLIMKAPLLKHTFPLTMHTASCCIQRIPRGFKVYCRSSQSRKTTILNHRGVSWITEDNTQQQYIYNCGRSSIQYTTIGRGRSFNMESTFSAINHGKQYTTTIYL